MGFTADLIVARRKTSLLHLPLLSNIIHDHRYEDDSLRLSQRRPDGWQVIEVENALPDDRDWLPDLVTATRTPVMIASVFESHLCVVRGLEPGSAQPWSVRLHPESRKPFPRNAEPDLEPPSEWMVSGPFLTGAEAVDAVARWSAAAGLVADRDGLAAAVAGKPEYWAESYVFTLLDAAGLGEPMNEWDDSDNHSLISRWLDFAGIERSITALKPGVHRFLECTEHPDCFAKVTMRAEGDYQLEYCDRSPEEHYVTVTPSVEKVVEAMIDWSASEVGWREDFVWSKVSTPQPE